MNIRLSYSEQLKHPSWQRRRLEVLSAANFTCTACGETEDTLHVHHKQYVNGRLAWEYSDAELVVLCDNCHQNEHESIDLIKNLCGSIPSKFRSDLISILAGIAFVTTRDNRLIESSHVCPLMLMAGMAAIKCNELDLTGISMLSDFLKDEIAASSARKSSGKYGFKG